MSRPRNVNYEGNLLHYFVIIIEPSANISEACCQHVVGVGGRPHHHNGSTCVTNSSMLNYSLMGFIPIIGQKQKGLVLDSISWCIVDPNPVII